MLTAGQGRMLVFIFTLLVGAGFLLPLALFEDWPSQTKYLRNAMYAIAAHGTLLLVIVEARRRWPIVCNQLTVTYVLATMLFLAVWFADIYEPYIGTHTPIDTSEGPWDPEAVAEHEQCLIAVEAGIQQFGQFDDIRGFVRALNAGFIRCDRALLETLEEH